MNPKNPGLEYYVNRVAEGRPFSFVRFGDGEWTAAILHDRERTSSGSQSLTLRGLQSDMRDALVDCPVAESYIPSLRPTSLKPQIVTWLKHSVPKGVVWHDCRVMYLSSAWGTLFPFVDALRNLTVPLIFVGPCRLWTLRLSGIFPKATVIVIPNVDCYTSKGEIMAQILGLPRPAFISFTAGPAAKVMIHQLYPLIGDTSYMIDCGSLWDVYVGHVTRRYMKTMTFHTIQRNLLGS